MPHFENPRGLFVLMLIIALSFLFPIFIKRKKGKYDKHPSFKLASNILNIQSFLYGMGAIIGFIILLVMSIK